MRYNDDPEKILEDLKEFKKDQINNYDPYWIFPGWTDEDLEEFLKNIIGEKS
jgi:hypothetical protein